MRLIPLLLLAQFTYPFGQNLNGGPVTLVCDGGISCSQQGETYYVSGSGAAGGAGGKVAEAYMADAAVTAQVANIAFSADASYISIISGTANVAYSADASYSSIVSNVAAVAYSADAGYYATEFIVNPTDCSAGQYATAIAANGNLTCATPSSGSGNFVEQSIALSGGSGFFQQVVTGQAWVTASSKITCTAFGSTADGLTVEAIGIAGLNVSVSDLSAGVGFTINVFSPYGLDGTVRIFCSGA